MNIIRGLMSSLLVAVAVLSALGIAWWADPPAKLAEYSTGGQVILGVLIASTLVGLWRLWTPARARAV